LERRKLAEGIGKSPREGHDKQGKKMIRVRRDWSRMVVSKRVPKMVGC